MTGPAAGRSFIVPPHGGNPAVARRPYGLTMSRSASNDGRSDQSRGSDGMPRNYLRACLLLILADGPAHGYDMAGELAALGLGTVDRGGMYRTLRAMEEEHLVASGWEPSQTGPLRRSYQLTGEGQAWLTAWTEAMRESQAFAAAYLRRFDRAGPSLRPPRRASRTSPAA